MLRLKLRVTPSVPLEAECIRPDVLCHLAVQEICRQTVLYGNREEKLGEFFEVWGNGDDGQVHLEGDLSRVKWLGAGMTSGRLVVHGPAGMHLGSQMRGGSIEVFGSVSDWLGAEMRGGKIHVHGDAGHLVGAAYRGSRAGMRGGVILVEGNAGTEVGHGLRRGLIVIGGDVSDFCGVNLIAGTICIFGRVGWRIGAGLKRGSIVLASDASGFQPLPTFRRSGVGELVWLRVLGRQLAAWQFLPRAIIGDAPSSTDDGTTPAVPTDIVQRLLELFARPFQRYCGDFVELPKGEILVRSS